jgi:hypothetical protein
LQAARNCSLNLAVVSCGSKMELGNHEAPAMFEVVFGGRSFA